MDNEEIQGVKFSEFQSATPDNADEVVGLHSGNNARFSVANFVLAIRQGLTNLFVPTSRTVNDKALSSDITLDKGDIGLGNVANEAQYSANNPPPYPVTSVNGSTGAVTVSVPSASDSTPQDLGTAAAGSSGDFSRADHVHKKPTASDIGAYVKPSGGIPASDLANGVIPSVPSISTSTPNMDGTGAAGSTGEVSDAGHVHPSDTSKANVADFHNANTKESLLDCNSYSTPLQVYQALMANPGATGAGDIGNLQSSQLKNFLTNPFYNYTHITFEFVSTGLIRVVARNASDATNPGKICYLKGVINNLTIDANWSVTAWEGINGLVTQATIATVESGSTASQNYYVGQPFFWNGVLHQAITNIQSGASFSENVNCKTFLVGDKLVDKSSNISLVNFEYDTNSGVYNISIRLTDGQIRLLQIFDNGSPALRLRTYNGSSWSTAWSQDIFHTEVTLGTNVLGTSFSPTSRLIGSCTSLFGIAATNILSVWAVDAALSPASTFTTGMYNGNFYISASQSCTLSSSVKFKIIYTK